MVEYINKAKLMRKLKKLSTEAYQFNFESKMETTINACIDVVDDMPTMDIIHCSECKYENGNKLYLMCSKTGCEVNPTHFCADGERKE